MLISKLREQAQAELDAIKQGIRQSVVNEMRPKIDTIESETNAALESLEKDRKVIKDSTKDKSKLIHRIGKLEKRKIALEQEKKTRVAKVKEDIEKEIEHRLLMLRSNHPDSPQKGRDLRERLRCLRKLDKTVCRDTDYLLKNVPELLAKKGGK